MLDGRERRKKRERERSGTRWIGDAIEAMGENKISGEASGGIDEMAARDGYGLTGL